MSLLNFWKVPTIKSLEGEILGIIAPLTAGSEMLNCSPVNYSESVLDLIFTQTDHCFGLYTRKSI